MKKRLHNDIAESILTINICSIYGFSTWFIAGILTHQWWIQLLLMMATNCIMIGMNSHFILLRIRSWMIISTFMTLTACCAFNYGSMEAGVMGLCTVLTAFLLFLTYLNPDDVGHTYYAYLTIGIASLVFVQSLYFVPLIWMLSLWILKSLNWRSWFASLLGLFTPYWFVFAWYFYQHNLHEISYHFHPLFCLQTGDSYVGMTPLKIFILAFISLLAAIGAFDFWSKHYEERVRTRQLYSFMQWIGIAVCLFMVLQPQHYDTLNRVFLASASPFIAHLFTLNRSKYIGYLFFASAALAIVLMMVSTSESLMKMVNNALYQLWNG